MIDDELDLEAQACADASNSAGQKTGPAASGPLSCMSGSACELSDTSAGDDPGGIDVIEAESNEKSAPGGQPEVAIV